MVVLAWRLLLLCAVSLLFPLIMPVEASGPVGPEIIAVSPLLGPAGRTATVIGTGWQEHGTRGIDVPIWIGFANVVARGHPDASGRFSVSFTIPASSPPGDLMISAIIGNGGSADAIYTVSDTQPDGCVDAYFIGVHGTAEDAESPEIEDTWRTFDASRPADKTALFTRLPYHAPDFESWNDPANLFFPAEQEGVNNLDALIRKNILTTCRTQSIVLVGYSLGAWVINDWLSKHEDIWPNIIAVELYGDPLWEHWLQNVFYAGLAYGGVQNALNPRPYENSPQGPGTGISDRWQSRCLQNDAICGEGYPMTLDPLYGPLHQSEQVIDAVDCKNTICEHRQYTNGNGSYDKPEYVPTTRGADWLALKAYPPEQASTSPAIVQVETFREGALVFFRIFFTNPNNDAEGFGFRGINGSGWAEENHPFTNPSYGRVSLDVLPGKIEYPFNHLCGTPSAYPSDIEVWIYDRAGFRSPSVPVELECSAPSEVITPFPIPSGTAR